MNSKFFFSFFLYYYYYFLGEYTAIYFLGEKYFIFTVVVINRINMLLLFHIDLEEQSCVYAYL